MTVDEFELRFVLPSQLVYETRHFGNQLPFVVGAGPDCLTVDQLARTKFARLFARLKLLQHRIRRQTILDRWALRQFHAEHPPQLLPHSPLTPMLIDEVIVGRRIVDQG